MARLIENLDVDFHPGLSTGLEITIGHRPCFPAAYTEQIAVQKKNDGHDQKDSSEYVANGRGKSVKSHGLLLFGQGRVHVRYHW